MGKQSGEKPVIGVNRNFMDESDVKIEAHPCDEITVRATGDEVKVQALLDDPPETARDEAKNIMAVIAELVKEGAIMGERAMPKIW